ncbi:hypothetical protein B9Q08_03685, partial [Candidatus Marsarchaeota G2 archaeon ECH_B_SAG-M15]
LYESSYASQNYTQSVNENLLATGGFSAILEVINQYGGSVVLSLGTNYAQTTKTLIAEWLTDGQGVAERFQATAVSPNVTDSAGYYSTFSVSYVLVVPFEQA